MIKVLEYGSKEYLKTLFLRNDLMRKPVGKNLFDEDLSEEKEGYIFGYYFGNEIVGTCVLIPISDENVKLRFFCVREDYQGKNIGKEIFDFVKNFARDKGYSKIVFAARKTAVNFYRKLNCTETSEEYINKLGLVHIDMEYKI